MNEQSMAEDAWGELRRHWNESAKKEKDYRSAKEMEFLQTMVRAWADLYALGWREIECCPKDGTRFLAITAGSTGVFPHYYQGEWPNGHWWCEAHGDLWPSRPILWKPMPSNAEVKGD